MMAPPPVAAADVIGVTGTVEQQRVARIDRFAGECRHFGIVARRFHELLQPVGFGKGIGVQQCDPSRFSNRFHRQVVGGRKSQIGTSRQHFDAGMAATQCGDRIIAAGVIDNEEAEIGERLAAHRGNRAREHVATVEIHDDDQHRRNGRHHAVTACCHRGSTSPSRAKTTGGKSAGWRRVWRHRAGGACCP